PVELRQTDDGGGVGLPCPLGKAPHDHVVVHAISKLAHDALGDAARRAATRYAKLRIAESMNADPTTKEESRRATRTREPCRVSGLVQQMLYRRNVCSRPR